MSNLANAPKDWIRPQWAAPRNIRAIITTRSGGVATGAYDGNGGMNLGIAARDDEARVLQNRAVLRSVLPQEPRWLRQIHGANVVDAAQMKSATEADAAISVTPGVVAVVMMADCLPVLLASTDGRGVAAIHAGWRGLAAGVIQAGAHTLRERLNEPDAELVAYLGPAIGPAAFEVGEEVLDAMKQQLPRADDAFVRKGGGKYTADLYQLARQALASVAVNKVDGGGLCTYSAPQRFYSYRRDGPTGRHAALIWIDA